MPSHLPAPTPCIPAASRARVVAPYVHTLWDAARSAGLEPAQLASLLERPAIGEDDVSVAAYLAMLQAARDRVGPRFGWMLGQQVKPTTYGVNGILLLACPTLGDALQQVLRFESLVHDLGRSTFIQSGDEVVYAWRNDCAWHAAAGALTESVFSGIQTCAQWLVGRTLSDFEIEFMHQADVPTPSTMTSAIISAITLMDTRMARCMARMTGSG